jgi:hypothetical protein
MTLMTREDIITELSARLRRQGVTVNRIDLEAFAASVPRPLTANDDIDSLALRFGERQAAALRRKRIRAWIRGMALVFIGVAHLTTGALFVAHCLSTAGRAPVGVDVIVVAIGGIFGITIGGTAIVAGLVIAVRQTGRDRQSPPHQ